MAGPRALYGGLAAAVALCAVLLFAPATPAGGGDLVRTAGARIVFGFYGTGPSHDDFWPSVLERIGRGEAAGVMLYARNYSSDEQMRALTRTLQKARPKGDPPLLILLDQEGGTVKRVPGAPEHSAAELGRRGNSDFARGVGRRTAENLRDIGINVNLAPVADVGRSGSDLEADGRTYSRKPKKVARLSAAFARGLKNGGVAATAKHFPGLGAAGSDQDETINRIELSKTELREVDERPFRRLADESIPLVMLSSAIYPAFDDRKALFSRTIVTKELREMVGFKGVALTDDLDTVPLSSERSPEKRAVMAARAGADLLMFAHSYDGSTLAAKGLAKAVREGKLDRGKFERAAERVTRLRESLAE